MKMEESEKTYFKDGEEEEEEEEEDEIIWCSLSELTPGAAIHNLLCRVVDVVQPGECTIASAHGTCTLLYDASKDQPLLKPRQVFNLLNGYGSTQESGLLVLRLEDPEEEALEEVVDLSEEDISEAVTPPEDYFQKSVSVIPRVYGLLVIREDKILLLPDPEAEKAGGQCTFPVNEADADEPERTAAIRAFTSLTGIDVNEIYLLNDVAPVISYEEEFVSCLFPAYTRRPFRRTSVSLEKEKDDAPPPYVWLTFDQAVDAMETDASRQCLIRAQAALQASWDANFVRPSFGKRFGPSTVAAAASVVKRKQDQVVVPVEEMPTVAVTKTMGTKQEDEEEDALVARTSALFLLKERGLISASKFASSLPRHHHHQQLQHIPNTRPRSIPVTVLSGFLGAGKTTLLNRLLLENTNKLRICLIVNDLAEVNIDARLIKSKHADETVLELTNGCICCTSRNELLQSLLDIPKDLFDYVIVESTGVGEPQGVAETFSFPINDHQILNDVCRLDTMVTLVDCTSFRGDMMSSVSPLLTEQIEFSNVLILTKSDLSTSEEVAIVSAMLRRLNPQATLLESVKGKGVLFSDIINTSKFDLEQARGLPGWLESLRGGGGEKVSETEEYGIKSVVFRSDCPLDSVRLNDLLQKSPFVDCVIRSKGIVWLNTELGQNKAVEWSGAGKRYEFTMGKEWDPVKGGLVEVVLIGFFANGVEEQVVRLLEECKVTTSSNIATAGGVIVKEAVDDDATACHSHSHSH